MAKPNMTNFLYAKTFETVGEANIYLNEHIKVTPTDGETEENLNEKVIPKLKAADWMMIGKIMKMVEGKPTYIDEKAMKTLAK
jgi:hypothetical protein